jgi:hypothetical protein
MNPPVKNLVAVIVGAIVGGVVNMLIIMISPYVIAPPTGVDVTNTEELIKNIHLFEPKHFIMPFLAHALGTLVGGFCAAIMAATNPGRRALIVGILFLIGGISAVYMIPAPIWYSTLDLVVAYIPMAFLGASLAMKRRVAAQ